MAKPENRPLDGASVVVCRAARDAGPLLARLRELGAAPIAVPLQIAADPLDGGAGLLAALAELGSYRWLAVTSANGARSILKAMGERPWPPTLRVAAVGPATARVFTDADIDVELVASPSTAADLARAFPPCDTSSGQGGSMRVLAPLAEAADDVLVDTLRASGYLVDRVDAYRMAECQPDDGQQEAVVGAQAVLFTAPSIVDRFIDRFSLESVPPVVISIGPRTTTRSLARGLDDLVAAGRHVLVEADQHDGEGLIEALVATLGSASLDGAPSSSLRRTGTDDAAPSEAVEMTADHREQS